LHSELLRLFPDTANSIVLKTGSEGVAAAIRLARSATRKSKVVRCGFHGWHDEFVSPYTSWHLYETGHVRPRKVPGVPRDPSDSLVLKWDGEDVQQLAKLLSTNSSEIAALILDPIQLREPLEENLQYIRQLTSEVGVAFILDEIKTGFRVSLRGVQGLYNIKPDLTIFSKAIANGFPLSVVLGKEEYMRHLYDARIMGTYNNELISVAAAVATLSILKKPGAVEWLSKIGQMLIDGLNSILDRYNLLNDVSAVPYRWSCLPAIWFHSNSEKAKKLLPILRAAWTDQGLLLLPNHPNFTCLAHTHQDIKDALKRFDTALIQSYSKSGMGI